MLITLTPISGYGAGCRTGERGYLPTLALSLKGEGVGCLVDEPVSQIIERPWGAGLKSVPRIVVRGRLYDSPPLSLGSSRSLMASPNMFRL